MYQRNAKQRNNTNLILVSFSPLQETTAKTNSKCTSWKPEMFNLQSICKEWETKKIRISKEPRTEYLQKASCYFKDEVYKWTVGLNTPSEMFAADHYCHKNYHGNYIGKWNRATSTSNTSGKTTSKTNKQKRISKNYFPFIKSIIDQGRRFSLRDIRERSIKMTMLIWKTIKSRAN